MTFSLLEDTSRQLADWYFGSGSGVLAACCHLAVDDAEVRLKILCAFLNCSEVASI